MRREAAETVEAKPRDTPTPDTGHGATAAEEIDRYMEGSELAFANEKCMASSPASGPTDEDVATGDKNVGDEAPRKKCECGFGGGLELGGCSGCGWSYSWGTWPGWQKLKGKGKGPPKLRRPGRAHGKGR